MTLLAWAKRYAEHPKLCDARRIFPFDHERCSCGLTQALREAR